MKGGERDDVVDHNVDLEVDRACQRQCVHGCVGVRGAHARMCRPKGPILRQGWTINVSYDRHRHRQI